MAELMLDQRKFASFAEELEGEFYFDSTMRKLYATDASAYREIPTAVALPKTVKDIQLLIQFARENSLSLIPRTAGTSLAGQVVGNGIVVDVSKYFNKVIEINEQGSWARVQPGVVRDDLNYHLKSHQLYFGPETSTANRAMIGGMVGNNSCGANSIIYGSTREHVISINAILSDGSEVEFKSLTKDEFREKCEGKNVSGSLEQSIYQEINTILSDEKNRRLISDTFPKSSIPRRNTGYALDLLMDSEVFNGSLLPFNFCKLIAGSEGTLAFITEIMVNCTPLPPKSELLICAHFNDLYESLNANLVALKYSPLAVELMDHYVLECTKTNIEQSKNRFFVQGDPAAILMIDLSREDMDEAKRVANDLIEDLSTQRLGYHFPIIEGPDTKKVYALRKAGLGLLANIPGDAKPAPVIEDTAVDVRDLPEYIREFNDILKKHGLYSVHYAHAATGELHLRPILNLKTKEGNRLFRTIAEEIAALVKKYQGSLSGEHGDGRLRGEFIKYMVGEESYQLIEKVKRIFDPENIFNPGKIVDTPPMDTFLRYTPGQDTPQFDTLLDFSENDGVLRSAELCNGSGDCRKTHLSGGTMCPSYMATKNEKETTRARANILREILTHSTDKNPFANEEIKEVMDLCLSCKGCKAECPSNVDVAKLKEEFLHQYYKTNGVPLRTWLIGNFGKMTALASIFPGIYNFIFTNKTLANFAKSLVGFASERTMPLLHKTTIKNWFKKNKDSNFGIRSKSSSIKKVYFFNDEFTNYNDVSEGQLAIKLLTKLGYEVIIPKHVDSGRPYLSKGLLKEAKMRAEKNVRLLAPLISDSTPLIGLEPSAILTFRDEYIDLLRGELKETAKKVATHTFTIDEFLADEFEKGHISSELFTDEKRLIKLHGHCHQKALSSVIPTKKILSIPQGFNVEMIPSGCCGMAGSFGYEKEHYELSMQVGELVLFPTVRKQGDDVLIAAPGTSCRHQIKDGTGRTAQHPVEILWNALKENE